MNFRIGRTASKETEPEVMSTLNLNYQNLLFFCKVPIKFHIRVYIKNLQKVGLPKAPSQILQKKSQPDARTQNPRP